MNTAIERIRERIAEIRAEFEQDIHEKRERFQYTVEAGKVRFQHAAKEAHRRLRTGVLSYLKTAPVLFVITAPFIYIVMFAFILLDVMVTVYQRICFPVYGIPQVKRADYLKLDRHKLHYLNIIQKLNCEYCSYGNGVLAYASEIAGLTELYWCPIKHAQTPADYHAHYADFVDYGDPDFETKLKPLRKKACEGCQTCSAGGTSSAASS